MLRQSAHGRTTFAGLPGDVSARRARVRRSATRATAILLRLIVAPFAAAAAVLAGLVFAVLLPICGIATISEGIARASWRFVRESLGHLTHPSARRI